MIIKVDKDSVYYKCVALKTGFLVKKDNIDDRHKYNENGTVVEEEWNILKEIGKLSAEKRRHIINMFA
jgi:hypothetical protein